MQDRLALAERFLHEVSGCHSISIDDRELPHILSLLRNTNLGRAVKTITVKMAEPTGVKMAHVIHAGSIPKLKEYLVLAKPSGIQGLSLEKVPKEQWDKEYNLFVTGLSREDISQLKAIIENIERTETDIRFADEICQKIVLRSLSDVLTEEKLTKNDLDSWRYNNAWRIVRTVATTATAKALADEKRHLFKNGCFSVITPQRNMYIAKTDYDPKAEQPRLRLLFADDYLTVHPGDFWQDIKTTGLDNEGGVELISGKKPEKLLRRIISMTSSPGAMVLDYFLGSGTTTAVAQKMQRRWVGIECSSFFDELPLTRMKLVLHGENGGISAEEKWQGGGCFKYLRLESYEDTLNNLRLVRTPEQQAALNAAPEEAREGYIISYFLDVESAGSASLLDLDQFRDPFGYTLKIATASAGVTKETMIDLVETFNWLLGLKIQHIDTQKGFLTVTGEKRAGGRTLTVWRTLSDEPVKDNEALDKFLARLQINPADTEFDFIYVNGSHTLADPHNKVHLIEETFARLMFEAHDFETLSE